MKGCSRMGVLFLQLEFPTWSLARHWSYTANLAFEEGLRANGVRCLTIPLLWWDKEPENALWFSRVRELCAGKCFDQVWIEIVHSALDEKFMDWLAGIAPIRVGFLPESLVYKPDDYEELPHLKERRSLVEKRLGRLTHVLALDEKDAEDINNRKIASAMWWTQAIPERFIREDDPPPPPDYAIFCGAMYPKRVAWLEKANLGEKLRRIPPPEDKTSYPEAFDKLNRRVEISMKNPSLIDRLLFSLYPGSLRNIRKHCFARYMEAIREGCAVVNLPHFARAYAGRVVEGMAAGRPVISWEIPDRPRTRALFEDGEEILLYPMDNPALLRNHIERIIAEPDLGRRIVTNARRKIKEFHTTEKRVRQILRWIETGEEPVFAGQ